MIKFIANIEAFGAGRYIAFIDTIKGMVVEGGSVSEVCKELLISLKVKMAYDYGVDINSIKHKEFASEKELDDFVKKLEFSEGKAKREINLDLSIC